MQEQMTDAYRSSGSDALPNSGGPPESDFDPDAALDDLDYSGDEIGAGLDLTAFQRNVIGWIRENQVVAMAGGFAFGVFLGVMLRD